MSDQIYRDCFGQAPEWRTGRWYHLGDRVRFCGMLLRCGVDHFAGDRAVHPWDPGWGWGDGASLLWTVLTPDGMDTEAEASAALAKSSLDRSLDRALTEVEARATTVYADDASFLDSPI